MKELLDVIKVQVKPNYILLLEFENGEQRIFDVAPLLEKQPFAKLKESNLFLAARVACGTVVWPGDIDIAPETLYDRSYLCPITVDSTLAHWSAA